MIRFQAIELRNFKNVSHGKIDFKDSANSSSVLGIYGQNGSGKTSVVEALQCIQKLFCCERLDKQFADYIGSRSDSTSIEVDIFITRGNETSLGFLEGLGSSVSDNESYVASYAVELDAPNGELRVASERLSIRSRGVPKRDLFSYDLNGPNRAAIAPDSRWRPIMALAGRESQLDLAVAFRSPEHRSSSRVFCGPMISLALAARNSYLERLDAGTLSKSADEAYRMTLVPLMDTATLLNQFANQKIVVCDTMRGAALAFNVMALSAPQPRHGNWPEFDDSEYSGTRRLRDIAIPIEGTIVIPTEVFEEIQSTVSTINRVLRTIVPGLSILVEGLNNETLDDGTTGIRVELFSLRNKVKVPFRTESGGIKKIVSMLGWLIDVYNDDSACLVIDEVDSGVFEFLLGELLEVISRRGKGQLIFTAHNLRALECLPVCSLVFTTTNPDNRYIRFKGKGRTNNLRSQYIRALNLGGQNETVYEPTDSIEIDSAFFNAANGTDEDFEALLARIGRKHG